MLFAFFSKNFLKYLIVLSIIFSPVYFFGEEGMWIPFEMDTNAMKRFGLEIPFAQLYSIEQESIKDAVVLFGGGCTGEIISSQGLLLTNHHCGYYFVASASDTINNYLKNGFWANSLEQEIPMPGLKVSKIVQYINITNRVYNKTENIISNELKKDSLIANHLKFILDSVQAKSSNQFVVKTTFNASQFYLLELQVFKDVRLVGVPPVNIGNFGGDYDNWLWPRHNADFAVFRIYAGEDNKPATYSKNNKPYVSNTFLKINISGVQENDFSMVYGFPGSTIPYLSSFGLESDVKYSIPMQIKIREKHLNVLKKYMENNEQYMLLYTAHSNKISNYYKKMEGQLIGLKYFDVLSKKKSIENDMLQTFSSEFDVLITNMDKTYAQYNQNILENVFYTEGLQMLSLYKIFRQFDKYKTIGNLNDSSFAKMFSDVYTLLMSNKIISIEKDILHTFLTQYFSECDSDLKNQQIQYINTKYGSLQLFIDALYSHSIFLNSQFLSSKSFKKWKKLLEKDPIWNYYNVCMNDDRRNYMNMMDEMEQLIQAYERRYLDFYKKHHDKNEKVLYPEANGSLRITYGNVKPYMSYSGEKYPYFTTSHSMTEKYRSNPSIQEYKIPDDFLHVFTKEHFGKYAKNDTLVLCYIASNHTTGGNSGSPVLNSRGELIGINFDRSWESTMSDYYYSSDVCRNIFASTNYILFIIDKYAKCEHIMKELDIIEP